MSPIECPECGRDWFRQETLFQFANDVFDADGEPEMADLRYIYRCVPCGSVLDLSVYNQAVTQAQLK